jgi:PTH1 family peptidyl-tRNA hydrolase
MKACFGMADFWRLRVGIGRPVSSEGVSDWVLSDFTPAETETLDRVLQAGAELLVQAFLTEPETLLAQWGKRSVGAEVFTTPHSQLPTP